MKTHKHLSYSLELNQAYLSHAKVDASSSIDKPETWIRQVCLWSASLFPKLNGLVPFDSDCVVSMFITVNFNFWDKKKYGSVFFDKRDRSIMPSTASKFKLRWFPNEGRYWAEK